MNTAERLTIEPTEPTTLWEHDDAAPRDAATPLLLALSDSRMRRVLAAVFSAAGYNVSCATEGREAAELAARQNFPILITEWELPNGGGMELAEALTERDALAETVLLACPENAPKLVEALDCGLFYNHFWKPLRDAGDLIRCVGRAMERREMRTRQARLLTELRDATAENRAYCARLEQLDKVAALGQMTESVAQNLRAPLANLRAYAQYLNARLQKQGAEPLTAEQMARVQDYLRDMERGAERCDSAVAQVMDYTRIHDEPPTPTCLTAALDESLALLRDGIEAQGITLRLEMATILPPVLANSRRLQQAIINLISNARQALGNGGGVIAVTAELADDNETLTLRVEDNGPGIAADALPHIFTPFFTTHSRRENLGLGLTIARSIAREWNGDLKVSSAPGRGVTAALTLPLCAEITVPPLRLTRFDDLPDASRRAA